MTAIQPYVRLKAFTSGSVLAYTQIVLDWAYSSVLNAPGTMSFAIGIGEVGNPAGGGSDSFATALLKAVGGPDGGLTPVPTLAELSVDGGSTFISRMIVETVSRQSQYEFQVSGPDVGIVLATMMYLNRQRLSQIYLADVLGKSRGAIVSPAGLPLLTAGNVVPFAHGVMAGLPGLAAWNSGMRQRIAFTAVADPAIAFLPTELDVNSASVMEILNALAQQLGGTYISGDPANQGARGLFVLDPSDYSRNLASRIAAVVCNGSPTPGSPGTPSNALGSSAGGFAVVGNVGTSPVLHFDGSSSGHIADETTTAQIDWDRSFFTPDLSPLYGIVEFIGGTGGADFPLAATITALITLNNNSLDADWKTCLPVIGVVQSQSSGGVYYYVGDDRWRLWQNCPAVPVNDIAIDGVNHLMYVATPNGVLVTGTDVTIGSPTWSKVGGLTGNVKRLAGVVDSGFVLYALVDDKDKTLNGVFRHPVITGSPAAGGYDQWTKLVGADGLIDMVSTDNHSLFVLHRSTQSNSATQDSILLIDQTNSGTPIAHYNLPSGVQGQRLDRVITAGDGSHTAKDSVWVSTVGDAQTAYYLLKDPTNIWSGVTLQPADADGSLATSIGRLIQNNRAVGLGRAIGGHYTGVFLCTDAGIFWMEDIPATGGVSWSNANGQDGLTNVNILFIAAGQSQIISDPAGTGGTVSTNRVFAASRDTFYVSGDSASNWTDTNKLPVTAGPYFTLLWQAAAGVSPVDYHIPNNDFQTIGPMVSSPIGGGGSTHLQADILPAGWYIQRMTTEQGLWAYFIVNTNCPIPHQARVSLSNIAVSENVTLILASQRLVAEAVRYAGISAKPQLTLTIESSCTQDNATLLNLKETEKVTVTMQHTVTQRSPTGVVLGTQWINLSNTPFFVLSHSVRKHASNQGAATTTVLGKELKKGILTPSDLATSTQMQLNNVLKYGVRGGR